MNTRTKKGTTVRKTARLHEKTVQAAANGKKMSTRRPRKSAQKRTQPLNYHFTLNPMAKKAAAEILAEGVYTKLDILDENTVIVR